jgi:hypothetical protein
MFLLSNAAKASSSRLFPEESGAAPFATGAATSWLAPDGAAGPALLFRKSNADEGASGGAASGAQEAVVTDRVGGGEDGSGESMNENEDAEAAVPGCDEPSNSGRTGTSNPLNASAGSSAGGLARFRPVNMVTCAYSARGEKGMHYISRLGIQMKKEQVLARTEKSKESSGDEKGSSQVKSHVNHMPYDCRC